MLSSLEYGQGFVPFGFWEGCVVSWASSDRKEKNMFTERQTNLLEYLFSWVKDPDKINIVREIFWYNLEEELKEIAILFPVLEETGKTPEELQEIWGLTEFQVEGLRALVRKEGENYLSYIRRIREVESARKVYLFKLRAELMREVGDLDKHWKAVAEHGEAFGILSNS